MRRRPLLRLLRTRAVRTRRVQPILMIMNITRDNLLLMAYREIDDKVYLQPTEAILREALRDYLIEKGYEVDAA